MKLPKVPIIDDATIINDSDLNQLLDFGFCYIKIPNDKMFSSISDCMKVAAQFFHQQRTEKSKWQLKETLQDSDLYQGYTLRTQSENTHAIEQFFFEPSSPFGPFEVMQQEVKTIYESHINLILNPLLKNIFTHLNLSEQDYNDASFELDSSLVFQYCPTPKDAESNIRLDEHKDFGLMTLLFFEKLGLEVHYQNQWHAIPPKPGYAVLNIGNGLEMMTNEQCHSALHRVRNAADERLSMVLFINPNLQRPVTNYVTQVQISDSGKTFFDEQFVEYYQTPH